MFLCKMTKDIVEFLKNWGKLLKTLWKMWKTWELCGKMLKSCEKIDSYTIVIL